MIIGAGHAGLAASYCLSERSIDHLVIERGEVANSWRNERWDSLTLLTPNWQSRLPGFSYSGDDPDGFMTMLEVVSFIDDYSRHSKAPLSTNTTVTTLGKTDEGYRVVTDRDEHDCRSLVIASGACNVPAIPKVANNLPPEVQQVTPWEYRNPDQLQEGGVLMVGASATGLQLAEEIHLSGRPVTISSGEHVRLPRTYRGKDIQWWMDATGLLDEGLDVIDDINRARHLPSPQLVGSHQHQILDLNTMTALGIKLVGRLMGVNNGHLQFSGSLANVCALADLKMNRLLNAADEWAENSPLAAGVGPSERFPRTEVDEVPCLELDLSSCGIKTIVWATGYRPDYSWLEVPVLDRKGMIKHDGGVTDSPGMYVLGMPFLRKRKSSFIHGAEDDARYVTGHLAEFLEQGL
ncbi:MAG: pyridine nucleotide-disulfide oxidoreductase [Xanthomonadales bacterium]|nr:pyridine nucleotide-disulfide oxidoreductase [Xanthomonadales bacterium]